MITNTFTDNAKVMSKGQITIPKDIREILGISCGDRVTFVVENGTVRLINSAIYAMQMLQTQMIGEAENTGLTSDDSIMELVKEIRTESEKQ
jgi:AbrB family looped-hinge helix DNA binding protein